MAAVQGPGVAQTIYFGLFMIVWASLIFSSLWFGWRIAPGAVERWAAERGWKVVRKKQAGIVARLRSAASNAQALYEVEVCDGSGKSRSGLIKVGRYWWPSLSVERCPVEATWDGKVVPDDWSE